VRALGWRPLGLTLGLIEELGEGRWGWIRRLWGEEGINVWVDAYVGAFVVGTAVVG